MKRIHPATLSAGLIAGYLGSMQAALAQESQPLEEVTVTATKQQERIDRVAMSVIALTRDALDREGTRNISDLVGLSPGVSLSPGANGVGDTISIRGISSTAGSPTTAIYIDDTPVQVRSLNLAENVYPQIFDLERVEVLRGPQGTLFGGSAEGGAIRFITPAPNLTKWSVYTRGEIALTQSGAPSQEVGLALGGPIVENQLGFRLSLWGRQDGGYVDRRNYETGLRTDDTNSQNSLVGRLALMWRASDNFAITPSFLYQKQNIQDSNAFWAELSDTGSHDLTSGNVLAQPHSELFELPALKLEYFLPSVTITSNSSFFRRKGTVTEDLTNLEAVLWGATSYPTLTGQNAYLLGENEQNIFSQEVRLQSANADATVNWVLGGYYSRQRLHTSEYVTDMFLPQLILDATGLSIEDVLGAGLKDGRYTVTSEMRSMDSETAVFGEVNYKIGARWKATLGIRAAHESYEFSDDEGGPVNGPVDVVTRGSKSENPITPKFGITDQHDENNMYYVTVAKGYRGGGAQLAVPSLSCNADLANLGIGAVPSTYSSDSLWSYEIGSKNRLADGRLAISSSLYYIDWSNIQQRVPLVHCGYNFYANLGRAISRGFDTQIQFKPSDNFITTLSIAYTDAYFKKTIALGKAAGSANLVSSGDKLDGYVPWSVVWDGEFRYRWFGAYPGYTRINLQFNSRQNGVIATLDQTAASYDPNDRTPPSNALLNARSGVSFGDWDVSLFINNVMDAGPILSRSHFTPSSPLYFETTYRPRTVGLTALFRF